MSYEVNSPELKEIQDVGLATMRAARARTADLKFDKLALDGATTVIKARKEDLVERLNKGRLQEMEAKDITLAAAGSPKRIAVRKKRAA